MEPPSIIMTIIISTITIAIIRFLNQPVCFRSRHIRNQNSMMPSTSGCGQRTTQGGYNRGAMFLALFDGIAINAKSHRFAPCGLGPHTILACVLKPNYAPARARGRVIML